MAHKAGQPPTGTAQPFRQLGLAPTGVAGRRLITALVSPGAAAWGMWAARIQLHLGQKDAVAECGGRPDAMAMVVSTAGQLPLAAMLQYLGADVMARIAVVRVLPRDGGDATVGIVEALEKAVGKFAAVGVDTPVFESPVEREMSRLGRRNAADVHRAMRAVAVAGAHVYFTAPRVRGQWPPRHRDFVTAPRLPGMAGDVFRMGGGVTWRDAAERIAYAEEEEEKAAAVPIE